MNCIKALFIIMLRPPSIWKDKPNNSMLHYVIFTKKKALNRWLNRSKRKINIHTYWTVLRVRELTSEEISSFTVKSNFCFVNYMATGDWFSRCNLGGGLKIFFYIMIVFFFFQSRRQMRNQFILNFFLWNTAQPKERKTKAKLWNDVKNICVGNFNLWNKKETNEKPLLHWKELAWKIVSKLQPGQNYFLYSSSSLSFVATLLLLSRNLIYLCCLGWFRVSTVLWLGWSL